MSRSNTEFIKQRHGKTQGSRADLAEGDGNVSCVDRKTKVRVRSGVWGSDRFGIKLYLYIHNKYTKCTHIKQKLLF